MFGKIIKLLSITILLSIILTSCFDIVDDVVTPIWDVSLSIPVTEREYTLQDAVEKDTTYISWYDGNNASDFLGVLYFTDNHKIKAVNVKENLTVDDVSEDAGESVGSVKINQIDPVVSNIDVTEWEGVQPGQEQIFPEQEIQPSVPFDQIDDFETITLDAGILILTIESRLPLDTYLRELRVLDADNQSVTILDTTFGAFDFLLPKIQDPPVTKTIEFSLAGKTFPNNLLLNAVLYSPGTSPNTVQIPDGPGTVVTAEFAQNSLEIRSATAELPEQDPFDINKTIEIDDSTFIETATFHKGNFELTFNNYIDVDVNLTMTIDNLLDQTGNPYQQSFELNRNQKNFTPPPISLSGWTVVTPTPGVPTNEVAYTVTVSTDPTNDPRTIHTDDSVNVNVNFNNSVLEAAEGKIKPTNFDIDETDFELDYGDFNDNFTFNEINFDSAKVYMSLVNSADIGIQLNTNVIASNGTDEKTFPVNKLVDPLSTTTIDLSNDFKNTLNNFNNSLPDEFFIRGNAIVNPDYVIGSVSRQDSVYGNVAIELPLNLGITGGEIVDTIDVDMGDIKDEDLERINYGRLFIEIENGVPSELAFTGNVLDSNDVAVLSLPPSPVVNEDGSKSNKLIFDAPPLDNMGNPIPVSFKREIELTGDQIKTFLKNKRISIRGELQSSGSPSPVKFRITDLLKVKIYGTADFRVDD